jgi:hypothetical protein
MPGRIDVRKVFLVLLLLVNKGLEDSENLLFAGISENHDVLDYSGDILYINFSDPPAENGISFVINNNSDAEAYTEAGIIGDSSSRYIPSGKYGYFKVDDAFPAGAQKVIFNITYWDDGYGKFTFQYNSTTNNYQPVSIIKFNSGSWVTITIGLTDVAFKNAQNQNADFRISGEAHIRKLAFQEGEMNPDLELVPATSGSDYSEFKGKSVAGYQAWFSASNTNSNWVHWSSSTRPEVGNFSFEVYPEISDYNEEILSPTGFENFGDGKPATLFSSSDVIDIHFDWMNEAGIDGVALQRFIGDAPYPINSSSSAKPVKVKVAAERTRKIFYICYDMSSGKTGDLWVESIKFDWVFNIEQSYALTSSPAYATINDKPVVQVWGPGFTSRVGTAPGTIELIEWLQARGCYVIGGVPTNWRTASGDSKPGFIEAYKSYDMVSPWTPGRYGNRTNTDKHMTNYLIPDKAFCDANSLDYLPVLFPGFAWSTWKSGLPNAIPRNNGQFLWHQAYNIHSIGIEQMYFAMFDEYDEGTAIMKGATDWSQIPTDQYFLTYSADGHWLSSDFYLRLAGEAIKMLRSSDTPVDFVPVGFSEGPVYYRNSFEKRLTSYDEKGDGIIKTGEYNLDPCFYNDALVSASNVKSPTCEIEKNIANAQGGAYYLSTTGQPNSTASANFNYKFSEVKIPVVEHLELVFWKNTIDELGKYVTVDLLFKSGKKLSEMTGYQFYNGNTPAPGEGFGSVAAGWEKFICRIGKGELLDDVITGIAIAYDKPADSGQFTAFFDSIVLSVNNDPEPEIPEKPIITGGLRLKDSKASIRIFPNPSVGHISIKLSAIELPIQFVLMDLLGNRVLSQQITGSETEISLRGLSKGIYLHNLVDSLGQKDSGKIIIE